ncbi:hypothetical protein Q31b_52590 [Novipirellula aureliae]|uniref:Type II secretion system protein G n=2 Tax=Novipirellula aureliae TaxID=2527966 RepID=A0A5C6DIB6_9BACT|nr:hypothetical protein Q31b_52590 [Novipirellula aureliae]
MIVVMTVLAALFGLGTILFFVRMNHQESTRASEAFEYLSDIRSAQQSYFIRTGAYANSLDDLDLSKPTPAYFSVGKLCVHNRNTDRTSWRLTLLRAGVSPLYGDYQITFSDSGFDESSSSIDAALMPQSSPSPSLLRCLTLAKLER